MRVVVTVLTFLSFASPGAAQPRYDLAVLAYRRASDAPDMPTPVPGITHAKDVVLGYDHGCAILVHGTVRCWGQNHSGQLGDGTLVSRTQAVAVVGLQNIAQLAAGEQHTCARTTAGSVLCWGGNAYGQSSLGASPQSVTSPRTIPGLRSVVDLAASGSSTCAVLQDGTVRCWGANFAGQLGDGTSTHRRTLVSVVGLTDAVQAAMGGNATCARTRARRVVCWGANDRGQLGIAGGAQQRANRYVEVADVVEVAAGDYFACARTATQRILCWGEVGSDGINGYSARPVAIKEAGQTPTSGLLEITARGARACVLREDRKGSCFNVLTAAASAPTLQGDPALAGASRVALMPPVQCAVLRDQSVACMGPASVDIPIPMPIMPRR